MPDELKELIEEHDRPLYRVSEAADESHAAPFELEGEDEP